MYDCTYIHRGSHLLQKILIGVISTEETICFWNSFGMLSEFFNNSAAVVSFSDCVLYFILILSYVCFNLTGLNFRIEANGSGIPQESYLHCKPIPVLKTGFSLCTFSHREKVHSGIPVLALY